MRKITKTMTNELVNRLNEATKNPKTYCSSKGTNIGHYTMGRSLNSYNLERVSNKAGGVSITFYASTEREAYEKLCAIFNFITCDLKSFTKKTIKNRF